MFVFQQDQLKKRISDVVEKVKLHPADVKSLEVRSRWLFFHTLYKINNDKLSFLFILYLKCFSVN